MQVLAQGVENGDTAVKVELVNLAVDSEADGDESRGFFSGRFARPRQQRLSGDRRDGRAACNQFSSGDNRHANLAFDSAAILGRHSDARHLRSSMSAVRLRLRATGAVRIAARINSGP